MTPNPFLGVFFHWLGGLASGSFYVPYKGVRKWSWETYWLVGGFFSWIICPWVLASLLTEDLLGVLGQQSLSTLWWTYFFGAMWGFGGLTFGLTMRYLGMSLGMGVALGYCAAFGTLLPPIFKRSPSIPVPETLAQIARLRAGPSRSVAWRCACSASASRRWLDSPRSARCPRSEKKKAIAEFSFRKGIMVATFSGIMSACFAFALTAGNPIGDASAAAGTTPSGPGCPSSSWCCSAASPPTSSGACILNIRNRRATSTSASHVASRARRPIGGAVTQHERNGARRLPAA